MKKPKIYNLTKLMLIICACLSVLMLGSIAVAEGEKQISTEQQMQTEQPIQSEQQLKSEQFPMIQKLPGDRVVVGENIDSKQSVKGDAVAIIGNLNLEDGAKGDAVAIIGNIKAAGNLNGDVVAIGGNITLAGEVNGNVVAIGGKINLKDGTIVNGDVVGSSIIKGNGVRVGGENVQLPIPLLNLPGVSGMGLDISQFEPMLFAFKVVGTILSYLILLGVLSLYPQGVAKMEDAVQRDTFRVLVIGFITCLLLLPLVLTIIGIPVVVVLILAAKFLGYAGILILIGKKIPEAMKVKALAPYLQLLLGLVVMFFISYIPIIGWFIGMFAFIMALGATIDTKFGTGKPWFTPRVTSNS